VSLLSDACWALYGLEANEMGTLTLFARDAAPASQREIFHAYGLQHIRQLMKALIQ
jgi:hypothetical protein